MDFFDYCPNDGVRFAPDEDTCRLCGLERLQRSAENELTRKPWKKLLYIKQDYPDNYVDKSFLEEMQKNVNVQIYRYWDVVLESLAISQHFSSIIIFIAIFIHLYANNMSASNLLTIGTISTSIGFAVWDWNMAKVDSSYKLKRAFFCYLVVLLRISSYLFIYIHRQIHFQRRITILYDASGSLAHSQNAYQRHEFRHYLGHDGNALYRQRCFPRLRQNQNRID